MYCCLYCLLCDSFNDSVKLIRKYKHNFYKNNIGIDLFERRVREPFHNSCIECRSLGWVIHKSKQDMLWTFQLESQLEMFSCPHTYVPNWNNSFGTETLSDRERERENETKLLLLSQLDHAGAKMWGGIQCDQMMLEKVA